LVITNLINNLELAIAMARTAVQDPLAHTKITR